MGISIESEQKMQLSRKTRQAFPGQSYYSQIRSGMLFLFETEVQAVLADDLYPAERIFDLAFLEACDEVVQFEGLRTALSVAVCVYGLFL